MDKQDFISLVLYYGRSKFFHSMQKAALDGLAKYPAQVEFRLFNGIALALGLRVQEAIRELNPLKNEQDLSLAAILALIYSHRRCNVIDKDALASLELKLKDERRNLNANSAYYAAILLFLTDKLDKARDYADKALKINDNFEEVIVLKAWTELLQNVKVNRNINIALEKVLSKGKNIDASLGLVKYFQIHYDFESAISVLNKISVRFPDLNIPLIEKMETLLAAWDWDQAFETALRIINLEPTNIAALRVKGLILLCRDGNVKAAAAVLQLLLGAAERVEMGNSGIIMQICMLFSRVCSRNKNILEITHKYIEKLTRLSNGNVEYITELGYQNILIGCNKDAVKFFRSATKVDNNFFLALCGLTLCQVMENGSTEQARQQIEFLGDLKGMNRSPLLLFLISKITEKADRALGLLIEATELHFNKFSTYSFGAEYLLNLDPDFLMQITVDLVSYSPVQIYSKLALKGFKDALLVHFKHSLHILEAVIKACPGHLHAIYIKAKIELLCGEFSMATFSISRILDGIDETFTDAYILLSQIQIEQKQFTKAMQSLEICLSHNFSVRENPLYRLLVGIVQKNQQQYAEAQKNFLCAMQLIGSPFGSEDFDPKMLKTSEKRLKLNSLDALSEFSQADKATLYLELIDVLSRLGQNHETECESERLLEVALLEFGNTPQEGRLILAHADIIVQKGNITKAIDLLAGIQPNQFYYLQAKTQLANIYLYHKKDRVAFARCFRQLVENCPETESYLMLGEAYMSIQEPDLAVEAYEKALKINPNDPLVAGKLGRAYVKTHQYAAAIKYYNESLNNPDYSGLKLDLAELYLKLKQYQNAADILTEKGDKHKIDDSDIAGMKLYTKQLLLLARIQEKSGNIGLSLQTLKEARDSQYRVFKRTTIEQAGNHIDQNKMLSKCNLEFLCDDVDKFLTDLKTSLKGYGKHDFIANSQAMHIANVRKNLQRREFLVTLDFSENYSFVVQNSIQSYHWNNDQATLYPNVIYYMEESLDNDKKVVNLIKHHNFIVISDCFKHDIVPVHGFNKKIIKFLNENHGCEKVNKFIFFSDGAGNQYKNKKNFYNLVYFKSDFNIDAEWHFFATSHGKSACDGIGATVKRNAARASPQETNGHITNAKALYDWRRSYFENIHFVYYTKIEYDAEIKTLEKRWQKAVTIQNTRNFHSFIPTDK